MQNETRCFWRQLAHRLSRGANLDSNVGVDGALGFVLTFPFWWLLFGLFFVLCYWFASLALNTAGVQKGTFYQGAGYDGQAMHNQIVTAGLGKWSSDYTDAVTIEKDEARVFVGQVKVSVETNSAFGPDRVTVKAGSMSREEQFYARPPEGNWE